MCCYTAVGQELLCEACWLFLLQDSLLCVNGRAPIPRPPPLSTSP